MFTMEPDFASEHVLAKGAAAPERAVEIDVDDVEPMLVGYLLRRRFASRNAGIIDEDINAAVTRRQLIGDLGNALRIRYIHDNGLGVQALRFQARATSLGEPGIAIRDHDPRSRLCQRFCAGQPDSRPAPVTRAVFRSSLNFSRYIFLFFLLACRYGGVARRRSHPDRPRPPCRNGAGGPDRAKATHDRRLSG